MRNMIATLLSLVLLTVSATVHADIKAGQAAPTFTLTDIQGKTQSLTQYRDKYVVLEWFNSECPFVQKHYESGNMQSLQRRFGDKGVVWLTINSTNPNSSNYRDPARSLEIMKQWQMKPAALMLDPDGKVGKMFGATATPHMWVIAPGGKVIYAGAIDDKASFRQSDVKIAKNFVAAALEDGIAGKPVAVSAVPAYGCSIKY